MRIFFSYANDGNVALVARLRDDLSARHEVWSYKEEIKAGDDWRRSVVDALLGSDVVVGFLSKKSTGDGGVCLDEMAIALHVKNAAITTVLVEPESQVRPPVSLSHIQWLDMHDWAEQKARGKRVWEKWYSAKLLALSALLDDPLTRHFSGEIDALRKILRPVTQSADIGVLIDGFVGREWLISEVDDWRRNAKGSRLLWLAGPPGMGKSTFSAWLAHHGKANVVGINLCRYNIDERRDAPFVLRTIAFQIASRLPDYRRLILERLRLQHPDGSEILRKSAPAIFEWLLAEPLRLSIDGGRNDDRFLVVIDGLDETIVDGRSEITEVLAASWRKLPEWIAIVVTSRREAEIDRQFADLRPLTIDAAAAGNLADIRAYVRAWLATQDPGLQSHAESIVAASQGNFLYLRKLREAVETGLFDLSTPQGLPQGLVGLYGRWFQRQFPTANIYKQYVPLLEVLAAAEHPVPADWVRRIFAWSKPKCSAMLEGLGGLFERQPEGLAPFHRSLRDWLVDDRAAGARFLVDADCGRQRLADALWAAFIASLKDADDGALDTFWLSELPIQIRRMSRDAVRKLPAIEARWRTIWPALVARAKDLENRFDLDGALAWWHMAAHLAEARGPRAQADRAFALRLGGDALRKLGRSREALEAYEASLAVGKTLAARKHAALEQRRDLALSLIRIGDVRVAQGSRASAFTAYRQSLEIMSALSRARPGNTQWMREVSVNLEKIGTLHALNQDTRDALRTFRKGLAIRRRLCRMDRSNAQWRHDLSVSLAKIGDILIEQADFAGALKSYHEGSEILSALRAEAPDNAAWRHAEHSIKSRIGDVLQQQDRIAEAAAVFQESLDVIRTLAEEAPGNREWRRDVSVGLSKLGDVLLRRRKRPDGRSAVSFYREALDIMQKLSAADPYNTAWEIEVVSLLWRLALAGDARRERASEAIAILHRLASQQRLGPEQREWIPMLESIRGRSRVART